MTIVIKQTHLNN